MNDANLWVVMELHTTLALGGEKRPIDNATGFMPVFDSREKAVEFANDENSVYQLEVAG